MYTQKVIALIDDDAGSFGPSGLMRKILDKAAEKHGFIMKYLLTEEEVINFHLGIGKEESVHMVFHDWDLSTLGIEKKAPHFSTIWSLAHCISNRIPVVIYTASEYTEVKATLLELALEDTYDTTTFQLESGSVVRANTVLHAPALREFEHLTIFKKNEIGKMMELASKVHYRENLYEEHQG